MNLYNLPLSTQELLSVSVRNREKIRLIFASQAIKTDPIIKLLEAAESAVQKAISEEREACAKVAESIGKDHGHGGHRDAAGAWSLACSDIAALIRAREPSKLPRTRLGRKESFDLEEDLL